MTLNDGQCKAILAEGLHHNFFEPSIPTEESDRLFDAERLVNACLLARKAGNKSDGVNSILFIAESDMKPEIDIVDGMEQTKISVENNMHNGLNLVELSDGILDQLITGLDKYPQTDEVEADRRAYTAEKERRENASKPAGKEVEEDSSAQDLSEATEKAGETAPESTTTADQVANQAFEQSGTESGVSDTTGVDSGVGSTDSAQGEDAGAFVRVQTPETGTKGSTAKATSQKKDGERAELESQLTYGMIKAHDFDLLSLSSAPISTLKFIIDNPSGPPKKIPLEENKDMVISESEVKVIPNDKVNAVGGISAVEVEPRVITKADVGIQEELEEVVSSNSNIISQDRDNLESLVTGPMLKAWGKGRREVPFIGDNELRLMVLNPTAQVSPEELQKAQKLDNPDLTVKDNADEEDQGILPGQERELAESEQYQEVPSQEQINVVKRKEDLEQVPAIQESTNKANVENSGQNRALEIINRENLPVPDDIRDEPPRLPNDVSICSRGEIYSLHARFHACEVRSNWIISDYEDKLGDIVKLKKYTESQVASNIPPVDADGKKTTNDYRDALVSVDPEVIKLRNDEHDLNKIVKKLKVQRDCFHLDCERLSRQMSKYEVEKNDSPR